jgi:hypothetical protein
MSPGADDADRRVHERHQLRSAVQDECAQRRHEPRRRGWSSGSAAADLMEFRFTLAAVLPGGVKLSLRQATAADGPRADQHHRQRPRTLAGELRRLRHARRHARLCRRPVHRAGRTVARRREQPGARTAAGSAHALLDRVAGDRLRPALPRRASRGGRGCQSRTRPPARCVSPHLKTTRRYVVRFDAAGDAETQRWRAKADAIRFTDFDSDFLRKCLFCTSLQCDYNVLAKNICGHKVATQSTCQS